MLLAVSFGVVWVGQALVLSGLKDWSFWQLMQGNWGVANVNDPGNLAPSGTVQGGSNPGTLMPPKGTQPGTQVPLPGGGTGTQPKTGTFT